MVGIGLVVVNEACCLLCCGSSWSSINKKEKEDIMGIVELDVKATCRLAKLVTDQYVLKDFHIQLDKLYILQNLGPNKVLKDTKINKTLKKLRDELLEVKGCSVGLEWISKHGNTMSDSSVTMGCDIQLAKESGVKLFGFLPENEFYKIDYLKWKGEGFSEFFDEEMYRIWNKNTGFLNGFRDILLISLEV